MKRYAAVLLVVGLLQMSGDLFGLDALKGMAAATAASPAPRVFSSVGGLETYSTRFFIDWKDASGGARSLELTPAVAARLRGPYNRRNVYGAVLAYGPVLANNPRAREMLRAVLDYGLVGDAPLLAELGIDVAGVHGVVLRYEPLPGTDMGELPVRIEVPLAP
jgi:hypothetical protein